MNRVRIETDREGALKVKLGKAEWTAILSAVVATAVWFTRQDRLLSQLTDKAEDADRRLARIESLYFTEKKP